MIPGVAHRRQFKHLSEQEVLALAIPSEEDDARIYRWYKHLREIDRQFDAGTLPPHLDDEIARLEQLEDRLAKVEVPLSYSSELYQLHLHLRYVIERLLGTGARR